MANRKYVLSIIFAISFMLLWGQGSSPLGTNEAHDALAREFFRLYTPESALMESIGERLSIIWTPIIMGMVNDLADNPDKLESTDWDRIASDSLPNNISYPELEEICIPLIREQFSPTELQELLQFFSTPTGRKYLDLVVLNSNNYMNVAWEQYIAIAMASDDTEDDLPDSNADSYVDIEALERAIAQIADIYSSIEHANPAQGEDRNVEFIPYDDPPVPIGTISPEYPDFAKRAGVQGTVVLEVEVYRDGQVGDIRVKDLFKLDPEDWMKLQYQQFAGYASNRAKALEDRLIPCSSFRWSFRYPEIEPTEGISCRETRFVDKSL
ncbi:MAG TPA: energy transducer TonB [Candidatus Cloacimonadota bacterium]|nr:energy transducer TonB [Candidatus Cloacimonadota bacterium]